jgi:TonB family protein
MQEAVSDILIERARDAQGMSRMVGFSILAHAALLAIIVMAPSVWMGSAELPENVMTISLGGAPGPNTGGLNPLSGTSVQRVAETTAKPLPEPPRPAAKAPEMVVPTASARATPKPAVKPIEKPADKSTSRTPTTGAEVRTGSSKVNTGAPPLPFGGLSSDGGGGDGARTDYANFCCPAYLRTMTELIKSRWDRNQGAAGTTHMKFVVTRDGTLTGIEVEKTSGQALLDLASRRALIMTNRMPPLPREFGGNTLTVYLAFEYQR